MKEITKKATGIEKAVLLTAELGKVRRYGLVGGGVSLTVSFEVLKAYTIPSQPSASCLQTSYCTSATFTCLSARLLACSMVPTNHRLTL